MTSNVDRLMLGAQPIEEGTLFHVWAPTRQSVAVHLTDSDETVELENVGGGYFDATVENCRAGSRYRYVLDGKDEFADPASRSQPDGVHGPSEVIDLGNFEWDDTTYHQRPLWDHVLYEVHIGTFSDGGTFDSAIDELDDLVALGVSALEIMPVAQFPGQRNWGYDGVFAFAVQNSYGGPHALQRFVSACHRKGLAVVLDVVYNHFGPEGNILDNFAPYFSDHYSTPWGRALNFDGAGSDAVRAFFLENARQWFEDFHVDALRLDAVHAILDQSAIPFLGELAQRSTDLGEKLGRRCDLIAESAANDPRVVTELDRYGLGMDAQWNDDFHHSLHVALTGERSSYYADYNGTADLARAIDEGFVLQGTYSPFRQHRHGAPSTSLAPERLVVFAQNHDHIGNRPRGDRLATMLSDEQCRLAAALVLLGANIPLLFMGEEYGELAPFPYFVDHSDPELIEAVREGRAREFADVAAQGHLYDPIDASTFEIARLDRSLRSQGHHRDLWLLYRDLIELRREVPALHRSPRECARAWNNDNVITMVRTHIEGDVVVVFNVSPYPTSTRLPIGKLWRGLFNAAGPEAPVDDVVALSAWGFCVYQSEAHP
jgi:maltooligosyltrehalose trehalohydrolase